MAGRIAVGVVGWGTEPTPQVENYLARVREAGLEPVRLSQPGQSLSNQDCAGLVLTGGVDVDPALYGQAPHARTQEPDQERDAFELALVAEALERDLPLLAICRGHQLLNVHFGGSLLQHIEDWSHAAQRDEARTSACHEVSLSGALKQIYGRDRIVVNSRHHQAVTPETLAKGLEVTAMSDDGYVEGFVQPGRRWLVSVQWHPERLDPEVPGFSSDSALLFRRFSEAVLSL